MSEKTKPQVTAADDDYSMEAVPESARKGFRSMFFVMLGFTFFSASMWVGQEMAAGLDFWGFIKALLLERVCGSLRHWWRDPVRILRNSRVYRL